MLKTEKTPKVELIIVTKRFDAIEVCGQEAHRTPVLLLERRPLRDFGHVFAYPALKRWATTIRRPLRGCSLSFLHKLSLHVSSKARNILKGTFFSYMLTLPALGSAQKQGCELPGVRNKDEAKRSDCLSNH